MVLGHMFAHSKCSQRYCTNCIVSHPSHNSQYGPNIRYIPTHSHAKSMVPETNLRSRLKGYRYVSGNDVVDCSTVSRHFLPNKCVKDFLWRMSVSPSTGGFLWVLSSRCSGRPYCLPETYKNHGWKPRAPSKGPLAFVAVYWGLWVRRSLPAHNRIQLRLPISEYIKFLCTSIKSFPHVRTHTWFTQVEQQKNFLYVYTYLNIFIYIYIHMYHSLLLVIS